MSESGRREMQRGAVSRHRVITGRYRDYQGNICQVTGRAKHAVTQGELVIYKKVFSGESGRSWVIPLAKFMEKVCVNGKRIPRFVRL